MNEQKLIEWLESMPWWSKLPYAKLEEELAISMAYADKLAAGLPGGILPKDVEVLRKANHDFAEENATLKRYVTHKPECTHWEPFAGDPSYTGCNCGLAALLEE